jgi:hypothetical protein
MSQSVQVRCNKCKNFITLNILEETDLGISPSPFNLQGVFHIQKLRENYDVANEQFILSRKKNIFHAACFAKARFRSKHHIPLHTFLQLYYLSLPLAERVGLLGFVKGKSSLKGISKQGEHDRFSTIFTDMKVKVGIFDFFKADVFQNFHQAAAKSATSASEDAPYDGLSIEVARSAPTEETNDDELAEAMTSFYSDPVRNTPVTLGSALNRSIQLSGILDSTVASSPPNSPSSFNFSDLDLSPGTASVFSPEVSPVASPAHSTSNSASTSVAHSTPKQRTAGTDAASFSLLSVRDCYLQTSFSDPEETLKNALAQAIEIFSARDGNVHLAGSFITKILQQMLGGEAWQTDLAAQLVMKPVDAIMAMLPSATAQSSLAEAQRIWAQVSHKLYGLDPATLASLVEHNVKDVFTVHTQPLSLAESPSHNPRMGDDTGLSPRRPAFVAKNEDLERKVTQLEAEINRLKQRIPNRLSDESGSKPTLKIDVEANKGALVAGPHSWFIEKNKDRVIVCLVTICILLIVILCYQSAR